MEEEEVSRIKKLATLGGAPKFNKKNKYLYIPTPKVGKREFYGLHKPSSRLRGALEPNLQKLRDMSSPKRVRRYK